MPANESEGPTILTENEVAELLRIRPSTVAAYARQGYIPSIQMNKHRRYVAEDIDAFVDSLRANEPRR